MFCCYFYLVDVCIRRSEILLHKELCHFLHVVYKQDWEIDIKTLLYFGCIYEQCPSTRYPQDIHIMPVFAVTLLSRTFTELTCQWFASHYWKSCVRSELVSFSKYRSLFLITDRLRYDSSSLQCLSEIPLLVPSFFLSCVHIASYTVHFLSKGNIMLGFVGLEIACSCLRLLSVKLNNHDCSLRRITGV